MKIQYSIPDFPAQGKRKIPLEAPSLGFGSLKGYQEGYDKGKEEAEAAAQAEKETAPGVNAGDCGS